LITFAKNLVLAILIIWIGHKLVRLFEKLLAKSMKRSNIEEGVTKFFLSIIGVASNVVLIFLAAVTLGLDGSSIVALIGSAGLAVGLALQGSLSNFAGGVLILLMKPFRIGDYIVSNGNEGTVTAIDIFYTRMLTADNRLVVIPNGILSNSSIINVTNEPIRRLDLTISIEYTENIKLVKDILYGIALEEEKRVAEREPEIFMNGFEPAMITLGVRVWVNKEDYWLTKWELLEKIKDEFEKNHIIIPLSQMGISFANFTKTT
jgi:small conductance mechanosensitive channel